VAIDCHNAGMTRSGIRVSGNVLGLPAARWDSRFLRACRGQATDRPAIWLMRQAGRYMTHYRGLRAEAGGFLALCKDPARAAEVTVFARDWLGVDAAIIFSDILVVPEALGLALEFRPGDGPHLPQPIRTAADVDRLGDPQQAAADLAYVYEALRLSVAGLPADIPCIGFSGAPFTLAAYAIEGGGSRHFNHAKAFMYGHPEAWHRLMARLVDTIVPYLTAQVAAGASALQIFDSWVGNLNRVDFASFVQPHLSNLVSRLPAGVPVILFGTGTGHMLDLLGACGADVVGLDHTSEVLSGWQRAGGPARIAIQGNLDPCLLLAPRDRLAAAARDLLATTAGIPGHIINLGHGVLKETDPEQARFLVDLVHG
jgi:uroporphyrinogen decarboxylase